MKSHFVEVPLQIPIYMYFILFILLFYLAPKSSRVIHVNPHYKGTKFVFFETILSDQAF